MRAIYLGIFTSHNNAPHLILKLCHVDGRLAPHVPVGLMHA